MWALGPLKCAPMLSQIQDFVNLSLAVAIGNIQRRFSPVEGPLPVAVTLLKKLESPEKLLIPAGEGRYPGQLFPRKKLQRRAASG